MQEDAKRLLVSVILQKKKKERFSGTNQRPEVHRPLGPGPFKTLDPGALLRFHDFSSPDFFSHPLRRFPIATNCPWVSEEDMRPVPCFLCTKVRV